MIINLLEDWKDWISKSRNQYQMSNGKLLSQKAIDEKVSFLKEFFPESFFQIEAKKLVLETQKNWLFAILDSKNISSVLLLNEVIRSLNFYNNLDNKSEFPIYKTNGKINVEQFREIIFELFVNCLLVDNDFKVRHNISYKTNNGFEKPLDAFFEYKDKGYLVECKKLYNSEFRNLTVLLNEIKDKIRKLKDNSFLSQEYLFVAVIGIKRNLKQKKLIHEIKNQFFVSLANYEKQVFCLPFLYEDENVEINIQPTISCNIPSVLDGIEKKYKSGIVIFQLVNNNLNSKNVTNVEGFFNQDDITSFLRDKIKAKFKQHKDATFHKILILEIENTNILNFEGKTFLLKREQIRRRKLLDLVGSDRTILIILKNVMNDKIHYDFALISNNDSDKELNKKLLKMNVE